MSGFITDYFVVIFLIGWGLLIVISFLGAFIRAVLSCIRELIYGEERTAWTESETEPGELYRAMSRDRKDEIDNLRKIALLKYLSRFTLTLMKEDMLVLSGHQADNSSTSLSSTTEVDYVKSGIIDDEDIKDVEKSGDIEEGHCVADENNFEAATAAEYTHISLPIPGYDYLGGISSSLCGLEGGQDGEETTAATTTTRTTVATRTNKWRKLTSLFHRKEEESKEEDIKKKGMEEQTQTTCTIEMVEKRNVPIFCAVCLDSYEISDQVCWASNKECTHVFHADCILQWLVSSGKKKSMGQIFEKHPSDAKLIQYRQCPCCRQDFISVQPDIAEEESV